VLRVLYVVFWRERTIDNRKTLSILRCGSVTNRASLTSMHRMKKIRIRNGSAVIAGVARSQTFRGLIQRGVA